MTTVFLKAFGLVLTTWIFLVILKDLKLQACTFVFPYSGLNSQLIVFL